MQAKSVNQGALIPVFSANGVDSDFAGFPITFERHEVDDAHGVFDNAAGTFTVKTAGLYLIVFNGTSWQARGSGKNRISTGVELRVDGVAKAATETNNAGKNGVAGYNLSMSALLRLKSGNVVSVVTLAGRLTTFSYLDGQELHTRFFGLLLRSD